ncbi:MAG: hypothetical protein JO296_21745 [Pseudonocardiales bacterium]|jgi:hypothetical protein|nr:hypothetical protein [Pseudonocardiales bacterium]MBV9652740.1 hypothetical protein [Pseudonocardiales bacterium]
MVFKILTTTDSRFFKILSRNDRTLARLETSWNKTDAVQLIITEAGNDTIDG